MVSSLSLTDFLSLAALLLQGFLVYYAAKTIKANGEASKRRAIVDLILKQRDDPDLRFAFELLYDMRQKDESFLALFEDPVRMRSVILALDTLEFVAVGIRLKAFDEEIYKQLQCSKLRRTWEAASGFVMELRKRKNFPTLYQDLEHLANKWNASPITELKKSTYRSIR